MFCRTQPYGYIVTQTFPPDRGRGGGSGRRGGRRPRHSRVGRPVRPGPARGPHRDASPPTATSVSGSARPSRRRATASSGRSRATPPTRSPAAASARAGPAASERTTTATASGAARPAQEPRATTSGPRSPGTRRSPTSPRSSQKIKAEHGPEALAFFSHGIGGNFLKHTFKAYGTPNLVAPSYAQCRGPRDVGFQLTFGEDVSTPERTDILNARCLVLLGSHLGENMHNTPGPGVRRGGRLGRHGDRRRPALLGRRRKAKHYLPVKPGTDVALLLAWMNVLVTEGLYDREFVAAHGFGFEAFAAEIAAWTPEWAYPITSIEPAARSARRRARWRATGRRRWSIPAATSPGTATTPSAAARWRCSTRCSATGAGAAASSIPSSVDGAEVPVSGLSARRARSGRQSGLEATRSPTSA